MKEYDDLNIIGYVILAKHKDETEVRARGLEPGWHIEFNNKIYRRKEHADDAVKQRRNSAYDRETWGYEIIPVYWNNDGRGFLGRM